MSASRRGRIDRLRRIAQKRVLAAEAEVVAARGRWEQARVAAEHADADAVLALSRWTDVSSADELAAADARRVTLRKAVERARLVVAERAREMAAREHALVLERQGEMRLEKVVERLAAAEATKAARLERRAGDEHAARLAQRAEPVSPADPH